jgi:hypothetical protein
MCCECIPSGSVSSEMCVREHRHANRADHGSLPATKGGWKKKRIGSVSLSLVEIAGNVVKTEGNRKLTNWRAINIDLAQPRHSLFL